jgi:alcohol dehydrogenase class IV
VLALRDEVGIPHRLSDVLSEALEVPAIARAAVLDPSAATNPITFKIKDFERVLRAAMSGEVESASP